MRDARTVPGTPWLCRVHAASVVTCSPACSARGLDETDAQAGKVLEVAGDGIEAAAGDLFLQPSQRRRGPRAPPVEQ